MLYTTALRICLNSKEMSLCMDQLHAMPPTYSSTTGWGLIPFVRESFGRPGCELSLVAIKARVSGKIVHRVIVSTFPVCMNLHQLSHATAYDICVRRITVGDLINRDIGW